MPSRRHFLKDVAGATGLAFVGCGFAGDAAAQTAAPAVARKHAPVTIKGRRIRTVDVHAHCAVPKANALMNRGPAVAPPAA